MGIHDKNQILDKLDNIDKVFVEMGCGPNKRVSNAIGIDAIDYDCVDIVGDIFSVLNLFPDNSVDSVFSYHFVEHIDDVDLLLGELARIMKVDGLLNIVVPHFSNPYFYSDPTHRTFFGLYTFSYFAQDRMFSRRVPTYNHVIKFSIESVDLVFKSSRPFYFRHGLKKLFGSLFNSCNYMKELYEENFCYLFPCYEVIYQLRKSRK